MATFRLAWDQYLSGAEYQYLLDFYVDTLLDGSLPVARTHPRTGASVDMIFLQRPPAEDVQGTDLYRVSFSMQTMP